MTKEVKPPTTNHQPLRIAIDANEANVSNRVGSNEYAYQIIKAIELQTRNSSQNFTILLTTEPVEDMPQERAGWKYQLVSPAKFATQFALPLFLFKNREKFDVFFTPGHYAPRFCPIPYVSSVMDLAFFDFSHQFRTLDLYQLKNWTKYSVKHARHVIAISEFTKQDIIQKYSIPAENITVAYPAIGDQITRKQQRPNSRKVLQQFDITQPYILYVGTIQPRKNLVQLIEAFEILKDRLEKGRKVRKEGPQSGLQLVIAGKIGWLAGEVIRKIERSRWKTDIRLAGYVTDEEKHVLYKSAVCSTLVGLYEGFGMPALESLSLQTIPVVSNTTSLPEVVGDAGILVNPHSPKSIAKGLEKALFRITQEQQVFVMKARNQIKKFSWEHSAQIILEVLESTATQQS